MDEKMMFAAIKNTIIEQNKAFLLDLSKKFKLDYNYLCEKYIKPEYYLPIVSWAERNNASTTLAASESSNKAG
jgi:mRNA deadenylase 3'-5' endonuclease subunit Ccr4